MERQPVFSEDIAMAGLKSIVGTTIVACVGLALAACTSTQHPGSPPRAKVVDVTDDYWGVTVHDPYRYMEDLEAPYVQDWFRGQADYADAVLDALPDTGELAQRLKVLDAGKPFQSYSVQRMPDGSLFFLRRMAGENIDKLYVHAAGAAQPRLLVDPEALGSDNDEHYSLETYAASPDGRLLVYGLAQGGSELTTYHVLDVGSGAALPDLIDNIETAYNQPEWLADSSGFFYSRRRDLPADADPTEIYKQTSVRFHTIGSNPATDPVIAAFGLSPRLPVSDVDFPSLWLSPGSDYAVLKVKHGDANEISLYSAPVASLFSGNIPWQKICDATDLVVDFAVHKDSIYLLTGLEAPRYRLLGTSLATPDFRRAVELIPPGQTVLGAVYAARDALYLDSRVNGVNTVLRLDYDSGALQPLQPPGNTAAYVSAVSPRLPGVFVYTMGWTAGALTYAYDPVQQRFTDTGLMPEGEFDALPGYVSEEVLVTSHDGTSVPLSIIHRADIELDGTNPTILYGYGSYGIAMDVYFSATRLAWLERGGIFAVAHVRGGGEYGQQWHYAGRMLDKPNTWKDGIACAQYLVDKGYTSAAHLAVMGGSAGGIFAGRAITERPDLFKAAVIQVGMSDTLRAETTTNGVPNIQEFGTVKEREGFEGLLAMSPYQHVQDGVAYPAVLLTHGFNDHRVEPWMSGKMAARLQAASTGGPVLLRVEYGAGHGIGSTREQVLQEMAETYSFLWWQLSDEG
jgi:prolyl oligopeptidase